MPIIQTESLMPNSLVTSDSLAVYCGLDVMVTLEVWEELQSLFNEEPPTYHFERALQGPILEIMLRGFLVDETERRASVVRLRAKLQQLDATLQQFAQAVWSQPLNPRSHKQLKEFFYGAMRLPEHWTSKKGIKKLSFDRETLEKLDLYFHARPIIACILGYREVAKQLEVLETEVDPDGRIRTSYNIAGTETWRLSSSASATGTGTNLQNITPDLRRMFISDPGWKLCVIDLEQAESREVGWLLGTLFGDWTYLDACEAGDLHTTTAKLIWKGLGWTGRRDADRVIAERPFYRHFSYRDMSKRGGHGCLTPDHEVLTRDGWVPITDKPAEILTWNETISEFAPVSNWTDHLYSGKLQSFDGNSVSLLMTHDHRVPYRSDNRSRIQEKPAEAGPGRFMPLGDNYVGGFLAPPARLIAAFMSDGYQKSANGMEFHLKKPRKIERLKKLCLEYGYECRAVGAKYIVTGSLPKRPGSFMLNWSSSSLLDFLDEYKNWDGHKTASGHVSLYSARREDLEWIQTLGRICGIGGAIHKPHISGYGSIIYKLQQNNRKWATGACMDWVNFSIENQRVLCPTVPSGWFYVRRNGKICVTGNTTYYGTPFTMARHLKVPVKLMVDFQKAFFGAYPSIPKWHQWVAQQIQTNQHLITPFGQQRHFFGRPNDDTTLREGIAFSPQSSTAVRTNLGLYKHWDHFGTRTQLLAQTHDSVTFQYRIEDEEEVVSTTLKLMEIPLFHKGRRFTIPGDAKVGWNWANHHNPAKALGPGNEFNPNGLIKWKGKDQRQRLSGLDRIMS